jgi:hypothetical protein
VHKSPELYRLSLLIHTRTLLQERAQQPGMTGQVKEDILSRIGELGINVKDGKIIFNPRLLRRNEFYKLKRYLIM